jgi:hypothetical protein
MWPLLKNKMNQVQMWGEGVMVTVNMEKTCNIVIAFILRALEWQMVYQYMILSSLELLVWGGEVVGNSILEVRAFSNNFVDSVANNSISWENCRTPCSQTNQAIQSHIKTQIISHDGKMSVPQKPWLEYSE